MAAGTLFDYLEWRGDTAFDKVPLNVIDSLIFTVFAYIRFSTVCGEEPMTLKEAARNLEALPEAERFSGLNMSREKNLRFLTEAADSDRFRSIRIAECVEEFNAQTEKQFAAVTFLLPGNSLFIAFRGTDNTIVGWKEDINMSFCYGIPAQLEAAAYVARVAEKYPDMNISVGGHSKGGNLAVWAAANQPPETQDRILRVYSMDGPGFTERFLESEGFQTIVDRVFAFVPESSIVGVLMGPCDYLTIKSSNLSLMQHDPFSWQVIGRRFVYGLERTASAKAMERMVNGMLGSMNDGEKEALVERIYNDLAAKNAKTLEDVGGGRLISILWSIPQYIREVKAASDKKS